MMRHRPTGLVRYTSILSRMISGEIHSPLSTRPPLLDRSVRRQADLVQASQISDESSDHHLYSRRWLRQPRNSNHPSECGEAELLAFPDTVNTKGVMRIKPCETTPEILCRFSGSAGSRSFGKATIINPTTIRYTSTRGGVFVDRVCYRVTDAGAAGALARED